MIIAIVVACLSAFFNLIFVLRWNLKIGINDIIFVMLTSTVTDSLNYALFVVPPLVALAKMTPKHVEATMFAFCSTVTLGGKEFGGRTMGVVVNQFVDVSSSNLTDLYKLLIVQMFMCLIPLFLLKLVPTS